MKRASLFAGAWLLALALGAAPARAQDAPTTPGGGSYTLPAATSSTLGGVKPDGTTISNAAGAISLNLGNPNTWTGTQTFPNTGIVLQGASTGTTTIANALTGATSVIFSLPNYAANDTLVTTNAGETLINKNVVLNAGTVSAAPLKMASGTNLTTPAAGAWEYDGAVAYFTVAASERGVVSAEQFEVLSATYTLTSQTAAQQLFNSTTNGAVTLAVGAYEFETAFALGSMSSTSGSFGFTLGGTATFTARMTTVASMPTTVSGSAVAASSTGFLGASGTTSLTASSTNGEGVAFIKGVIRVSVAGTVIPEVSLTTAAAAVVQTNSYFKIAPIGASGVNNVGNWS